ncbi:MAG: hypothetical protein J0L69_08200 [Bacteroidetes bacterium]|nr:hypothetical protein [Bacteroidota bacterium]
MKKDLHEFEQHLKQKLDNAEFPFDEQNWEKARAMIDASRSNNRPKWIFFLSSIALILTLGVVYYTQSGSSNNEQPLLALNDISKNQQSVQPSDMQPVNPATSEVETAANVNENKLNNNDDNNQHTNRTTTNNNTSGTKKSIGGKSSSNVSHTEASSDKTQTNSNSSSENSNSTTSQSTPASNTNPGSGSSSPNGTAAGKESSETIKLAKSEKSKSTTQTEIPVILGSNLSATNKNNTVVNSENKGINSNREGNLKSEGTAVITNNISGNDSKVTDSLAAVVTKDVIEMSSPIADTNNTQTPVLAKVDSTSTANDLNLPSSVKPKIRPKFLYAEAGATYLFGWNVNGSQEANGFNAVAGINYQQYISPKVSLTAGLQYNSIGNLSNSTYTASTTEYNFGVQRDVTAIKYIRIHYISVPIKLGVDLGKNNTIGFGANTGFLLNSDSQTEKYRTNNAEPMNESNRLSTKKETGYVTGFNSLDVQASVFYRRRIYKGLSANAEFIYGFTDIKKNDHFKNNTNERAMGVKVTLCLDLFKK